MSKHFEMMMEEWRGLAGLADPYAIVSAETGVPMVVSADDGGALVEEAELQELKRQKSDELPVTRTHPVTKQRVTQPRRSSSRMRKGARKRQQTVARQIRMAGAQHDPERRKAQSDIAKLDYQRAALKSFKHGKRKLQSTPLGKTIRGTRQDQKPDVGSRTGDTLGRGKYLKKLDKGKPNLPGSKKESVMDINSLWVEFLSENDLTPEQVESVMDEALMAEDHDTMDTLLDLEEEFEVWLEAISVTNPKTGEKVPYSGKVTKVDKSDVKRRNLIMQRAERMKRGAKSESAVREALMALREVAGGTKRRR